MNKGEQQNQTSDNSYSAGTGKKRKRLIEPRWLRVLSVALLFASTLLIISLILLPSFDGHKSEDEMVNTDRFQAVFLTGGQVYFGRIDSINKKHLQLSNIFYLRTSTQVQPNSADSTTTPPPELVPLGCELHRPQNQMQINREQVIFWENLQDESDANTVPGAIKKFIADNPNGQKCAAATQPTTGTTKP